ncbi:hypothetical protein FGG08_001771 [Glutinoglossum americanum]|uniref:Peptidase S54 rhomboid domain-containing protein n=1 Tax=Glutinoglossum americanum TaxID=1670608 RepID=A0A9P8IGD3_9PEZI|nr:hypothetical protein FGG08_001771 [Glutinoglossum americanum]
MSSVFRGSSACLLEKGPLADLWVYAVYRLNTYPLIHANFLHMFINCVALAPLLERFEAEHGTLMTLAMFAGLSSQDKVALGYLKILAPPEKILRWVEGKMNLLGRLPHYVSVDQKTYGRVVARLDEIFKSAGLKVARQKYEYTSSGKQYSGENVYSILHAPRGDATEAVVLVAAWRNMNGELNESGVALVLTLARYFKRWSLWSKDIIFLITADSRAGPQAWVDAYHDAHSPTSVSSLPLKGGALQGVVVVDYPFSGPFETIHIVYDGINGQLPNLDLFNTAVSIASGQMGIGTALQQMWKHNDGYRDRLRTMLRGMVNQGLGHASGPHSSFIPYHVDAITLQVVGSGSHDEMALGRTIESLFRSLNNLLEHFHQSFFFYLLMQTNRFVSIGTYLPSAMLIVVNFTITAMSLWVQSGRPGTSDIAPTRSQRDNKQTPRDAKENEGLGASPMQSAIIAERKLFLPLAFVIGAHFLGVVPLYVFNHSSEKVFVPFPTLNFSLAFLVGLSSVPLAFVRPIPERPKVAAVAGILMSLLAPTTVLICSSIYWEIPISDILIEAAFGWDVWGMWTQVVVWCVWWPAWLTGTILLASSLVKSNSGS